MSYFDDYIEPYIGMIPDNYDVDPSDYDTKEFIVKRIKTTDKATLYRFVHKKYDAWVPNSLVELADVDGDYLTIEIPDWFKLKPVNEVKEIELGVFK